MAARGSRKQREEASDEIAQLGLKVRTLGAAYARAAESEEDNAFTVIDNLLDPGVSLKTSFRDVVAFWIETFRVQARLGRDIYSTLLDSAGAPAGPKSGVFNGQVSFSVPAGAQATDPVVIDVPVELINGIAVAQGAGVPTTLPRRNIYVSLSSDAKAVQVALINLDAVPALTKVGQECAAQLDIPDRAPMTISAVRSG